MSANEDRLYLLGWAEKNGCNLETHGSAGFGRPAVGIIKDSRYVELGPTVTKTFQGAWAGETYDDQEIEDGAWPPEGVEDAYHKHDCLCVLARGADESEDYDEALRQLALWVRHLEACGFRVETALRRPSSGIDLLFHGATRAYLTSRGGDT